MMSQHPGVVGGVGIQPMKASCTFQADPNHQVPGWEVRFVMLDNTVVDVENIPCARVFIHHQGQDISIIFSIFPHGCCMCHMVYSDIQ